MEDFIRIQFKLGKLTPAQVMGFAPKWITEAQAREIIGTNEV